jgi:hypothetical protein
MNINLMSHDNYIANDDVGVKTHSASTTTNTAAVVSTSPPLKTNTDTMKSADKYTATSGVQVSSAVGSYDSSSLSWRHPTLLSHPNPSDTTAIALNSNLDESQSSGNSNTDNILRMISPSKTSSSKNSTILGMLSSQKMLRGKKKCWRK